MSVVIRRLNEFGAKHKQSSWFKITVEFIKGIYRLMVAMVYLRNVNKLGVYVSVNGMPLVENAGYIELGNQVRVWSKFNQAKLFVRKGASLIVGENSRINGVHISVCKEVIIGKNVRISPYVLILDSDHHNVFEHFDTEVQAASIIIEDNVWIASKVTILKGVRIGEGAVIAAGAVVTRDVEPFTLAGGIPARFIKSLK